MKYINHKSMKKANSTDIFYLIKNNKQLTRKQIEELTGLSWGAVSNITGELVNKGYVIEKKQPSKSKAGRIPKELMINPNDFFFIGLDINISGLKAVLVNLENDIKATWNEMPDYTDKDTFLKSILAFIDKIMTEYAKSHILGMGIAMQGEIDTNKGMSINVKQCKGWENVPLLSIISDRFQMPVFIEHDPDCILYAEHIEKDLSSALLIRLDRSIGMAVMSQGAMIRGKGMLEIGKMVVSSDLNLEDVVTQNGIERAYMKPFKQIADDANANISYASEIFKEMNKHLSMVIVNMSVLFNVKKVILCGNIMEYKDVFFDDLNDKIQKRLTGNIENITTTDIKNAAYGAALIAIEKSAYVLDL